MDLYQDRQLHQIIIRQISDRDLQCILGDNLLAGNIDIHRTLFLPKVIEGHGALKMAQGVLHHQGSGDLKVTGVATFLVMVLSQWDQLVD